MLSSWWKNKHRIPILLFTAVFSLCIFMHGKDMRWLPLIQAEGLGYYSYLPACFIYQDKDFAFAEQLGQQYYGRDIRQDFLNPAGENFVNKYFPGVSLLLLPFFLLAHALALLGAATPDGYSMLYQYAVGAGAAFWLVYGFDRSLTLLKEQGIESRQATLAALILVFCTNLLYNSTSVPSQSHVYSYATLCAAVLHFRRWCCGHQKRYRNGILFFLFFSLSIAIRPLALLALPAFLFFISHPAAALKATVRQMQRKTAWILSLLAFILPIIYVMLWWKIQCGSWMVYAYTGEHFYFLKPHLLDFLFSFRKGWMVYHPVFFLFLAGMILLLRQSFKYGLAYFLFWLLLVYVHACWWIWTYSVPFGQRVMIDYLVFTLPAFCALLKWASAFRLRGGAIQALILLLASFNLWRTWQYHEGIIPWEYCNKDLYVSSIFQTHRQQRYLVNEARIQERSVQDLSGVRFADTGSNHPNKSDGLQLMGIQKFSGALPLDTLRGRHRYHWRISGAIFTAHRGKQPELQVSYFGKGLLLDRQTFYFESSLQAGRENPFSIGAEWTLSALPDSMSLIWSSYSDTTEARVFTKSIEWLGEDVKAEFEP